MIDLGRYAICSASPELFFDAQPLAGGRLQVTAKPMKGTAARLPDPPADRAMAEWLRQDEKNRAENVMIVDMLRNDLGRIAETGSVARAAPVRGGGLPDGLADDFNGHGGDPCRPVRNHAGALPLRQHHRGAQVRTMQIIAALEDSPRRIYTGATGWIAPESTALTPEEAALTPESTAIAPGLRMQFSVAIRTALVDRQARTAEYGVGGVVWDRRRWASTWRRCSRRVCWATSGWRRWLCRRKGAWRERRAPAR